MRLGVAASAFVERMVLVCAHVCFALAAGRRSVDFGFAYVDVAGERQQVALLVMPLPVLRHPGISSEVHGGIPRGPRPASSSRRKIRYDNSKIAGVESPAP